MQKNNALIYALWSSAKTYLKRFRAVPTVEDSRTTRNNMPKKNRQLNFHFNEISFDFEIDPQEVIISSTIEETGSWEANQLILYGDLVSSSGVFVDIGANIGINSIYAHKLKPGCRIFCIEPSTRNFELLARNISANCTSNVLPLNMAIADHNGSVSFEGSGTNAHITLNAPATVDTVPCKTLDSMCADNLIEHIDVLKIDVEGYTDLVLAEASHTLKITRNLIVEFSYGDIINRIRVDGVAAPTDQDARKHTEELFSRLMPFFKNYYYISRKRGLIALDNTKDLFKLMFTESRVGDVLCTNELVTNSMSSLSYTFELISELMYQNHLRIVQIQGLSERK